MEDNFDDIQIELGEGNVANPEPKEIPNEIPNDNVLPEINKEEEKSCLPNNCETKKNWLSGIFGCMVGAFGGCIVLPFILICILFASIGSISKGVNESKEDYIAVIPITGVMTTGSSDFDLFGSSGSCGSDTVCNSLKKAADDNKAKAIVLRVNSPGGTPAAAEEIGEAVKYAKSKKLVYVSMADMGCSAAYWVSSLGSKIYVNRTTMTGSIGVIMNGMDITKLLDKIGVSSQIIKSGKYKDIGSSTRPMTGEEKQILQNLLDNTYDAFLDTVAQGRKMPKEKVKSLAEGMIYTGDQAVNKKLADEIGTYEKCISDLAKEVKMDKPVVKNMGKKDFLSQLSEQDLKKTFNIYLINELKNILSENQLEMR